MGAGHAIHHGAAETNRCFVSFAQVLTRVLVHDPNPLLAGTICEVLETRGAFSARPAGEDLFASAAAFRPSLIVVDPEHLPLGLDGFKAEMTAKLSQVELVAYLSAGGSLLALRCIAAGFAAAVSQSRGIEVLIEALNSARLGGVYIDACLAMTAALAVDPTAPDAGSRELHQLSPRERQVLEHVARGFSNKEIAAQIGLSPKTVETHRARAAGKLGLRRKSDIVDYAIRNRWLTCAPYAL